MADPDKNGPSNIICDLDYQVVLIMYSARQL